MLPIYKKEIRTYFTQMTGYIFLASLVLLMGLFFVMVNVYGQSGEFYQVLSGTTILFFILIPALTMRLFAEETRHKTDQLLFTSPLSLWKIVTGKFLAALTLFTVGVVITMLFPLMLSPFGALPMNMIVSAYIGYYLLGACFIAIGMFISILTENQIIAAVVTFAVLLFMFLIDANIPKMPIDTTSSFNFVAVLIICAAVLLYFSTKNLLVSIAAGAVGVGIALIIYLVNDLVYGGLIGKVMQWVSLYSRFANIINGIIHIGDILFYISMSALFIYLTVNTIEKRRWR
jgi:ABC-2 type transport system permease protein